MSSLISRFLNLPGPARIGIGLGLGAGVLGSISMVLMRLGYGSLIWWILLIGGLAIALLFAIIRLIHMRRERKRAAILQGALVENTAAAGSGLSDADERARLDQIRKDFEEGLEKFRASGKDVSSPTMPWYLLVGEPGSGKTEVVRHCNVGFPPGLNKELQGSGGTLNMDWWFTNHAVVIDTAGRLMFNDTTEWRELLGLLTKTRPQCPINGLLLVIPTDSLLQDTSEQIQEKATRIASQLNAIQRTLDVRFPVFVIVTKSDKLTGFRQFFETLEDPQLQHQILGWSNAVSPDNIDEPFQPELVDNHLQTVRKRLIARRMALLMDPPDPPETVSDDEPKPIDRVDALYSFPDELKRIAPRLRRYLELIFTAGEWSPRPLFLRGIYFTSSMQEGAELDTALAEMLGVTVGGLPEGGAWRKDKAYFLRDLFMEKVFPERGLVTRASNAAKQYRRNRLAVIGAGAAAVLLFFGLFIWTLSDFRESIDQPSQFWQQIADQVATAQSGSGSSTALSILVPRNPGDQPNSYNDNTLFHTLTGEPVRLADVLAHDGFDVAPRGVLRPISWLPFTSGDLSAEQRSAQRAITHVAVLRPLLKRINAVLSTSGNAATSSVDRANDMADVLEQLLRIARYGDGDNLREDDLPELEPLLRAALNGTPGEAYLADREALQDALDRYFLNDEVSADDRPFRSGADLVHLRKSVDVVLSEWATAWNTSLTLADTDQGGETDSIAELAGQFQDAEDALLGIQVPDATSVSAIRNSIEQWTAEFTNLQGIGSDLQQAVTSLNIPEDQSVHGYLTKRHEDLSTSLGQQLDRLRALLPPMTDGDIVITELADAQDIGGLRRAIRLHLELERERWENEQIGTLRAIAEGVEPLDASVFAPVQGPDDEMTRRYALRLRMYEAAHGAIAEHDSATDLSGVDQALAGIQASSEKARSRIEDAASLDNHERVRQAATLSDQWVATAVRYRSSRLSIQTLNDVPTTADAIGAYVEQQSASTTIEQHVSLLKSIPLVGDTDEAHRYQRLRYDPDIAVQLFRAYAAARADAEAVPEEKAAALREYADGYFDFWLLHVPQHATIDGDVQWSAFIDALAAKLETRQANQRLEDLAAVIGDAITRVVEVNRNEKLGLSGADDAQAAIARINMQVKLRNTPEARSELNAIREKWVGLGKDMETARRRLLDLTPATFTSEYLPPPIENESASPGLRFWDSLPRAGLAILARDATNRAREARLALAENLNRYPLAADAPSNLNEEQLQTAGEYITRLAAQPAAGEGETPTLGNGATTRFPQINDLISTLRGETVMRGINRSGIADLQRLATSLLEGTAELHPAGVGRNQSVVPDFDRVDLRMADRRVARWDREGNVWVMAAGGSEPVSLSVGDPITIEFYTHSNDPPAETRSITGPWTLVRALHRDATEPGDDPDERGWHAVWHVPVALDDVRTAWIELRTSQRLPTRDHWPTRQTWPIQPE